MKKLVALPKYVRFFCLLITFISIDLSAARELDSQSLSALSDIELEEEYARIREQVFAPAETGNSHNENNRLGSDAEKLKQLRDIQIEIARRNDLKPVVTSILPERDFSEMERTPAMKAYMQARYELAREESIALNAKGAMNRAQKETALKEFRERGTEKAQQFEGLREAMLEEQRVLQAKREKDPAYQAKMVEMKANRELLRQQLEGATPTEREEILKNYIEQRHEGISERQNHLHNK